MKLEHTWWLLLAAGLMTGSVVWLVQRAFFMALQRHHHLYTSEAEHRLRDLFVFVDLRLLWPAAAAAGLFLGTVVWLLGAGPMLGASLALLCWFAPKIAIVMAKRVRTKAFEQQLPDALAALAASIRAGASLVSAMQALVQHAMVPLSQEFGVVSRQIRLGATPADALQHLATRLGGASLETLSLAMRVALQTGGPMAAVLEQTGQTLQAQQQLKARVSALTSQGWMQAWVMGAMPVAMMVALSVIDPNFQWQLLHTSTGHLVCAAVAGFEALGMWWLRQTTRIRFTA
jgi:tight adherence protein B